LLAAEQQERLFTVDHGFKISRQTMAGCLQAAQAMVADNASIWRYGQEINRAVTAAFKIPVKRRLMASSQPKGMVAPAVNR
jgi:hypothetical protein